MSLSQAVRSSFRDMCSELFEENPDLTSFGWTQYSPYFNDGDACIFSVNLYDLRINGRSSDDYEEDEDNEGFLAEERETELRSYITDLLEQMPERDFESMFGNHATVEVTAGGIEIGECDHD